MSRFEYTVKDADEGKTIKEIVRSSFSFSSRLMTKLKKQDLILLNGKSEMLWKTPSSGDIISVLMPEEKSDFPPEDIPIDIIYEDNDVMVINKQPGVVVHPTKGKPSGTIANGLSKLLEERETMFKIRFVNRLDMNTSGLLIVAKNSHSQDSLTKQMKSKDMKKEYIALVHGIMDSPKGRIRFPIGRPEADQVERWYLPEDKGGYDSITDYEVSGTYKDGDGKQYSLLSLSLKTGRTHQIRVHLSYTGHPIVGDHLYWMGDPFEFRRTHGDIRYEIVSDLISRQALHACRLSFIHPVTGESMIFEAPLPSDIRHALETLTRE